MDYQFPDYLDERYFPVMKVDKDIIPDEDKKEPYKGNYFPHMTHTAPQSTDRLLKTWKYMDCAKEF